MAQACCEPVLQSSIQQWGSYIALTSVALLWCCITANLYEEKISIGVIALAQAYAVSLFYRAAFNSGEAILP